MKCVRNTGLNRSYAELKKLSKMYHTLRKHYRVDCFFIPYDKPRYKMKVRAFDRMPKRVQHITKGRLMAAFIWKEYCKNERA